MEEEEEEVLCIYFDELTEEAQKKVLKLYTISEPGESNLDQFPLFVLAKTVE